jgi:mono/diheme cytochrome c family protein
MDFRALLVVASISSGIFTQIFSSPPPTTPAPVSAAIERGKYLVESVAACWQCHTPRNEQGELDRTRWLLGAPVFYRPASPISGWADVAPRLAGLPPGTAEQFITLMMTGVSRTGSPPRPPMPRFSMTRSDAEAVLAYLKSLGK